MSIPLNADEDGDRRDGRFAIEISDETFDFKRFRLDDDQVTGAQVGVTFGKHDIENYVVLHQLPSGELESLRPTELTDIGEPGRERFFVIEGDETNRFRVAGLSMEWPRAILTADQIVFLARADDDSEVVVRRGDAAAEVYEGDDEVRLDTEGVEDIRIRPARQITVMVDGEPYQPPRRRMTPNEIIAAATTNDPAQFYLVRIRLNEERISYKDKGDIPIRLRDGMKFATISIGPTPVSDPAFETGPKLFIRSLEAMGYQPRVTGEARDHIVIDYPVMSGRLKGKVVKVGLIVPPDFPMTWPSGPHISPKIHAVMSGGDHPTGGVHDDQAPAFAKAEGGEWQYWSRPYNHRGGLIDPVQAYLNHIWKLWDTQ